MRGLRGGSQKSEKGKHPPHGGQKKINENPKQKRMIICPF